MAITKSGWYVNTLLAGLTAVAETGAGGMNVALATNKVSLVLNTASDASAPLLFGSTTQAWVNTFEATGTGWVTGGVALSTTNLGGSGVPQLTISAGTPWYLQYSWTAGLAVSGTTLTNVYGMIVYCAVLTAPIVAPNLLFITFGAAYNTVAGVFGVTPSGSGLSQITLTQ